MTASIKSLRKPSWRSVAAIVVLVAVLGNVIACNRRDRAVDQFVEDAESVEGTDGSLTFQDVTLEQVDEKGQLVWKVRAQQARYSQDQKVAKIKNPTGELYQDGKKVFEIKATEGEVQQDGKKIFLTGQITATDTQDGTILKGRELEWRPQDDVLIVRNSLTATHPQITATANEARAYSRARRMEFLGGVTANAKNPVLRMKADRVEWLIAPRLLKTDRPVQLERVIKEDQIDRASGDQATVNLGTQIVQVTKNANFALASPPLTVRSNVMTWNVRQQTVASDQPVVVKHSTEQITLRASQGQLNLATQVVTLVGNVQGSSDRLGGQLTAELLTWTLPTKFVEAEGNVVYVQTNPPLKVSGPRASGKLDEQIAVVSGGRVTTELVP
ncbi:MAG: LPS export ABC transporter periplasmic protein LptC [Cyanobacteria bacterium]|nr:LPS export ABC transporter periplasmic protein LptC [Cyanobacteriota bacterium]MDW8202131.1 LPS export ABC transporter periplasmic protein LptC [Cyanobacteriota bacterium SKYGB_h_bin112]